MIFSTYWFLAACVAFLPLYWLIRNPSVRLVLLLGFCLIFHTHFAGPAGIAPIIVLGLITYAIGRSRNRLACTIGIALAVVSLLTYKYTHFFFRDLLSSIHPALGKEGDALVSGFLPEAPPLAISFFVFEFVHYLFEVRKGGEPIRSLADFAQFTFYFPSLVAGPIKRYTQFIPALHEGLTRTCSKDIVEGLIRVCVGFFKKAVIADNLTLYINFNAPRFAEITMPERWLLVLSIAMRIYMDFSGYSDMAIGFSKMMGIELPQNFNWPYVARNIQDFWQRWHISLSSWIRDYVYIPLGGNRFGHVRRITNGILAFTLCGLWHGPAWNFVLWGLYHGLGLAVCSSYRKTMGPLGRVIGIIFDRAPICAWACTMLYVSIGWLLFFYPVGDALRMTSLLFARTL